MQYTLAEIERIIAKHSPPPQLAQFMQEIPSLQDRHRAVADLKRYHAAVEAWASQMAAIERSKRIVQVERLEAARQAVARDAQSVFPDFGVELADLTTATLERGWDSVADGLERRERDDRLLGRARDDVSVSAARELRRTLDKAREFDSLIDAAKTRAEGVDPYEIDEAYVRYANEYASRGMRMRPEGSGRPVMDVQLESQLEQFGILGTPPGVDDAA